MTQIKINPQSYNVKITKDGDVVKVVNTNGFSRVDVSNFVALAVGNGDMTKAVYDPTNKNQDVFAYADGKIAKSTNVTSIRDTGIAD